MAFRTALRAESLQTWKRAMRQHAAVLKRGYAMAGEHEGLQNPNQVLAPFLFFGLFGMGAYVMYLNEQHEKDLRKKEEDGFKLIQELTLARVQLKAAQDALKPSGSLIARFVERVESNPTVKANRALVWEDMQRELKTTALEVYMDLLEGRALDGRPL
eukprot:Ihof_evm5s462 gene=Ihof_evmTU5s462